MVSTRSTTENRAKEGTEGEQVEPTIDIELGTPDQSVDEVGKKTTESTPMPNAEEPNPKPMEFSPIDNVEDTTGDTPETVKDESQKKTCFTEKLAMTVGMRSRGATVEETKAEKSKTFGTVSTRTTETDQNEDQKKPGPATDYRTTTDHGTTTLELSDLMAKLDQIDEKLKHMEEDRNTKLDAILRNSAPQDRAAAERTQGNRVDFVEPQRNKRQSTPLPVTRETASTAPVGAKAIIKSGTANTTSGPGDSTTHNNVGPDAMTWGRMVDKHGIRPDPDAVEAVLTWKSLT
ncbi:uncharacterized protein LOC134841536 [Symsagittifera roscoffensis]|uniref:uncharacterized protein LOC134841536 n=1 Tax=Symsagittifera roscoffensis TaxID=84072 RepID=UPI00307C9C6C